jgi:Rrf2 family protein
MLTMKARYAIRALTALASLPTGHPVLTGDIAKAESIPQRFLEGIFHELRRRGVLQSRRGRGGGYSLVMSADEITVEAVVTALDGPIASSSCPGSQGCRGCQECKNAANCGSRLVLERVRASVATALRGVTIAELVRHAHNDTADQLTVSGAH